MNKLHDHLRIMFIFLCLLFSLSLLADHQPNHNPGGNPTLGGLDCTTDQIVKFNGTNWVCAEDETGPASDWVVLDNDSPPKPVGEIVKVNFFDSTAEVAIPIGNEVGQLLVNASGFIGNLTLYFKTSDCSGIPYYFSTGSFDFIRIPRGIPGDPSSRPVLSIAGPEESFVTSSRWSSSGCSPVEFDSDFYPLSYGEDLHITYPPPYSLDLH